MHSRRPRHALGAIQLGISSGSLNTAGTYFLQVKNPPALGLPTAGAINVRTRRVMWTGITGQVGAQVDLGLVSHTYTGNVLSFPIFQTDTVTT
ncbi:hypothetical protein B0H14DRAFT_3446675 [Mycena olivaceomarginata]|nr:hypothetical protein B0H14DRAFT_3446675 [Mycena olivaceomarginata]